MVSSKNAGWSNPPPPYDAERASADALRKNYCAPPGVELAFDRSTLIVGSRGAGKTMLLRHQRQSHRGFALYGDLFKILAAIATDTGAGGLTTIPAAVEVCVKGKTAALLAHWIAERALEQGYWVAWRDLSKVLPRALRAPEPATDERAEALDVLYESLFSAGLTAFKHAGAVSELQHLVANLNENVDDLLLLLDRAEMVPQASVDVVLSLMDQTNPQVLLMATRPGIFAVSQDVNGHRPTPGDHFNLRQLAQEPYESAWNDFMVETLKRWLPYVENIPAEDLSWILFLSRDSLRTALEIVYNSFDESGRYSRVKASAQLFLVQDMLIKSAHGALTPFNSDVRKLINQVRKQILDPSKPSKLVLRGRQASILHEPIDQFVDAALRRGFLACPQGVTWHPYALPSELEIPPLYLWDSSEGPWPTTMS